MRIKECLKLTPELEQISESPRLDVEVILGYVIGRDRTYLYTWPDKTLDSNQLEEFNALIARRIKGEPVAYILGEKEFWSLPFYVNNSTLIPRPDTEKLVELALEKISSCKSKSPLVLDLGTGTGAIAITLANECPHTSVIALDKYDSAVELARKNIERHQLNNIQAFTSDWFEYAGIGINPRQASYDIIVSNPPYIDVNDHHLNEGDVRFEPKTALVSKKHGLADIALIIQHAKVFLAPNGWLLLEHGWQQAKAVQQLFLENDYNKIQTEKDLSGHDRITFASLDNQ